MNNNIISDLTKTHAPEVGNLLEISVGQPPLKSAINQLRMKIESYN